jgi:hypothetical protein
MIAKRASLGDIAAEITNLGVPALFVDTCTVFDVVRAAAGSKEGVSPRIVFLASRLLDAQRAGELLLYGHSNLPKEAARRRLDVESDAKRKALVVDRGVEEHRATAAYLGVSYPYQTRFTHESLITPLIELHDRFLDACTNPMEDPTLILRAFARSSDARRPARQGGGTNDCMLFEEFRQVALAVPAVPLVLLTTNPSDFADKSKGNQIHHEISDDLAGTAARVCVDWEVAARLVLNSVRLQPQQP